MIIGLNAAPLLGFSRSKPQPTMTYRGQCIAPQSSTTGSVTVNCSEDAKSAIIACAIASNRHQNRSMTSVRSGSVSGNKVLSRWTGSGEYSAEYSIWVINNISPGSQTFSISKSGSTSHYHGKGVYFECNRPFANVSPNSSNASLNSASKISWKISLKRPSYFFRIVFLVDI